MQKRVHGFSLVELSIVLVILGLLTGGILSGQSLIRASEIRSVIADLARYNAAVYSFRDKYFALPGDMTNATAFWGKDNTNCPTASGTVATPGTCNGDGDGQVGDGTFEMFRFWQQLALAGLIEGSYTGITAGGNVYQVVLGSNAPKSKMTSAGYSFSDLNFAPGGVPSPDAATYGINYGNLIWFGSVNGRTQGDVLKPEEAWNIDTKLDDGKPATGKVIARPDTSGFGHPTSCTTDPNGSTFTGTYNLSNSAISCALMVETGY